ncbi:MAG TPA: cytochrome c3 family protein [Bacteroidales bacterium]|nr:cytochrome c3 family protein [Bacteroidales bacterium]
MSIMKIPASLLMIIASGLLQLNAGLLQAQEESEERVYEYLEENQGCLKCHGHIYFYYVNENLGREIKERMNPYFFIDSADFYASNHWNFMCTDCHSYDYSTFPHPNELRMEPSFQCLDCHGGDDTFARFNFEGIDEEFHKSVHSSKHSEDFTCWMCHNPHSYKINARTNENMQEFITYDNEICLSCHSNISKYQLLTTLDNPNILTTHNWLPNQGLHFKNVRCIECHAEINNDILVAHNVQPKEKAVKLCVECHSKNSRLLTSLYKLQFTDERSAAGFSNAAMLEESYIIGANRNVYLNSLSILMFGLAILFVLAHASLRLIIKRS